MNYTNWMSGEPFYDYSAGMLVSHANWATECTPNPLSVTQHYLQACQLYYWNIFSEI